MNKRRTLRILWEKTEKGTVRILRMYGAEPSVRLPEKVEGLAVTEIGAYCFSQNRHLPANYEETIAAEECVENGLEFAAETAVKWETEAEKYLTELAGKYLTEVILPDSLEKIGNLAFYNCTALEKIELGSRTETIGSDAFMNCRNFHKLCVRCSVTEKSGVRQILHQVTSDIEVTFQKDGEPETAVFYPEYYESLDEVAPAHLFHRNIEGEGFRARQCFKEDVVDLAQYDMIFPKACAEESGKTLQKIVCTRLYYPLGLTETAENLYKTYLQEHETEIAAALTKEKELKIMRDFCEKNYFSAETLAKGIEMAAEQEWAEGVAALLHLKQEFFGKTTKERYTFEEF